MHRKLVAVRALIDLYAGSADTTGNVAAQLDQSVNTAQRVALARDGRAFAKVGGGKVGAAAEAYLRRIGRRAQSPEIARALEAEGFEFNGREAASALASALSHNPLFDNVPKQGYGLREWSPSPSP